jgi:hypothetical protein
VAALAVALPPLVLHEQLQQHEGLAVQAIVKVRLALVTGAHTRGTDITSM